MELFKGKMCSSGAQWNSRLPVCQLQADLLPVGPLVVPARGVYLVALHTASGFVQTSLQLHPGCKSLAGRTAHQKSLFFG